MSGAPPGAPRPQTVAAPGNTAVYAHQQQHPPPQQQVSPSQQHHALQQQQAAHLHQQQQLHHPHHMHHHQVQPPAAQQLQQPPPSQLQPSIVQLAAPPGAQQQTPQQQGLPPHQQQQPHAHGGASAAAAAAAAAYLPGMVYSPTNPDGTPAPIPPGPLNAVMGAMGVGVNPVQPDESPTYVNPKQYHRILKRRESRRKLTGSDVTAYTPRKRQYMHESRHKHAKQRKRGPGGRFLSKAEREAHAASGGAALDDNLSE